MGIEEGTFWDEHWVLYGNQFDNKFHVLTKNKHKKFNIMPVLPPEDTTTPGPYLKTQLLTG